LRAIHGNILSEQVEEQVEFEGVEMFLALTANDEVNSLAALNYAQLFDRQNVYQLAPTFTRERPGEPVVPGDLRGTILFGDGINVDVLRSRIGAGATLQEITVAREQEGKAFRTLFPTGIGLFAVHRNGRIEPVQDQASLTLQAGWKILALVEQDAPESEARAPVVSEAGSIRGASA
jgi:Trk K+ transport system NAD-binding subunit